MVGLKTPHVACAILAIVLSDQDATNVATEFEPLCGPKRVELAEREVDGISVVLYWTRETNVVTVAVADFDDYFELVLAEGEPPLDVFYHPFAYARARGLELASDVRQPEVQLDALDA